MNPITLIAELRKSDKYIESIFMHSGCYKFHLFMKAIFPNSKPYLHQNRDHVATEIDGILYDIKGEIKFNKLYKPLKQEDLKMVKGWSFHKNNLLKLIDCPSCCEPIVI